MTSRHSAVEAPTLAIDGLQVKFRTARGVVEAVREISFTCNAGETLAIVGESGSGKSVTAAAIMGLIDTPPGIVRANAIDYRGTDLLRLDPGSRRQLYGTKLAMVFQDPLAALNPLYTVGWQIAEVFRLHGIPRAEGRRRALGLLERVGVVDAERRINSYPHQLSGGQRQRVVIAIAIALRPDILIADEPTSALDVTVQARILDLLGDIQRENRMSMLLITHDLGVAVRMADRVVVMQDGRIVETGTVRDVVGSPDHGYTKRLVASIPGLSGHDPSGQERQYETVLKADTISKTYALASPFSRKSDALVQAVSEVSFELGRGECLGIVGESGSGKSTFARLLLGLEEPSAGHIQYEGRNLAQLSGAERLRYRRGVQAVFQDPTASLNPYMTVEEIISEPWQVHRDVVPKKEWPAAVGALLQQVGLERSHARRYPHQFSGGQRQRIAIARALALTPQVIVCDEAVSALDVSVQAQVLALLEKLRRERGLSYVFIAHDLSVVRDFCDRVLVMHRGMIVESGDTGEVFRAPQHQYTRELLSASPVFDPALRALIEQTHATASATS